MKKGTIFNLFSSIRNYTKKKPLQLPRHWHLWGKKEKSKFPSSPTKKRIARPSRKYNISRSEVAVRERRPKETKRISAPQISFSSPSRLGENFPSALFSFQSLRTGERSALTISRFYNEIVKVAHFGA